jgi:ribosome maturation factor RimP
LNPEEVMMASTQSIRELAEPVLASAGLELWDVEINRDVVRIMVDRPGGIDLDALTAASGALSPVLDTHPEVVPEGRYQLEVSSPGVERSLRTPAQYRRYLGAEITVKTSTPVAGARRHRGRLLDAGEGGEGGTGGIVLEPDDAPGARLEFSYDQIDRARTVLVWGQDAGTPSAPSPGAGIPGARNPNAGSPSAKNTGRGRTAPGRRAQSRQGAASRPAADPNRKDAAP